MIKEAAVNMETDLIKANDKKRPLHESCGVLTNSDSFSIAKIGVQDNLVEVNKQLTSFVGTLETCKDAAQNFSEVRSMVRKKTRWETMEEKLRRLDLFQNSGQSQTDKLPQEVGLTNTNQMNTVSTLTLSNKGNSEENNDSFNANEIYDASFAIIKPPVSQLRNKLLVLDLNGLLADIVYPPPWNYTADAYIAGRAGESLVLETLFANI